MILARIGVELDDDSAVRKHLSAFQGALEKRWDKGNNWWELRSCDYYDEFLKPKIVWPIITKSSRFCLDRSGIFLNDKCFFIPKDDLALLGILNSSAVWFWLRNSCSHLKGGYYELRSVYMKQVPIPEISTGSRGSIERLVQSVLKLHDELAEAFSVKQKRDINAQILEIEREIDQIVYSLYGLSESEISLIERTGSPPARG